ncbi:doxx family protein [Reichenbachiella agarivorans]|uniref:Doxx family protein n=1 Tax=Reichenbachiella agarivorans TaxID=2979464 RepID=A0ABY6CL35_9BACT|nr:doxx family protein [Reichenbachiella agarivorans]UXP31233.1 doxx family protein [Reichenbachiella agarivorans]
MSVKEISDRIDFRFHQLVDRYSLVLLELSIGLTYLWFGILKFFPSSSPAEVLAADTMEIMTFHLVNTGWLIKGLATWEVLIGLSLILRFRSKYVLYLLLVHMGGTLSPMIIFPEQIFVYPPFGFTLVGQYIMKNFIIISAALVIYSKSNNR